MSVEDPHKTNVQRVKERFQKDSTSGKWWKPAVGRNQIRILPPWGPAADGNFYLVGALHAGFRIGGRQRMIACPEFSDRGKCLVCEMVTRAKQKGDEELAETADAFRAKKKFWVNMIDRKNPKQVVITSFSQKGLNTIISKLDDPEYGDVTDLEGGHDIIIRRTGTGMYDTRYEVEVMSRPSPLLLKNWKKKVHQLDTEVLEWWPEKEIRRALRSNCGEILSEIGMNLKEKGEVVKKKRRHVEEEEGDEDEND